jgi:ADP-ribosylglycohydrolase
MSENRKGLVLASFAGDSLALGVHWIYSGKRIAQEFGRVEDFLEPQPDSYHPTKGRGEFTHYGDQTLVLLQSLAEKGTFDLGDFSCRWQSLFAGYAGYYDQATRATLHNFSKGASPTESGSSSNEIAGAARIAPLVYCLRDNPDALVAFARAQTFMTHKDPLTVDSSEFFARTAYQVLLGTTPVDALSAVAQEHFADTAFSSWVEAGMKSAGKDSISTIKGFGQSCHTPDAFPGIIHLIAKYENDLREALIQAVMAGGDSAVRAMIVGMILGAHLGMSAIPGEWISRLKKADEIELLLDQIRQIN